MAKIILNITKLRIDNRKNLFTNISCSTFYFYLSISILILIVIDSTSIECLYLLPIGSDIDCIRSIFSIWILMTSVTFPGCPCSMTLPFVQRLGSALCYAICSVLITIVNKVVLTSYGYVHEY